MAVAIRPATICAVLAFPFVLMSLSACGTAAKNDTFDLSASSLASTEGRSLKNRQILVPEPTALKTLDSENIVVRLSSSEVQYLASSQWSDRLPKLVQSKLVEAFENTGKLGGVGRPGQGLAIDYQVVTDIRSFEIDTKGGNVAVVEISVKILNDRNGTIKAQESFRAETRSSGTTNAAFVKSLDGAFAAVSRQIVDWTLKSL
ncbi:cholesterol transport system auxiliary component [Rhizobium sp. BIGb0125]|nr:cholesterol transport system auxiliary component [Rhizobium sp. BIGb0125]